MKTGDTVTMTLGELSQCYDELMFNYNKPYQKPVNYPETAKGFTIGRGKRLYWYLIFQYKNGWCRCYPNDGGYYQTVRDSEKLVTVHF